MDHESTDNTEISQLRMIKEQSQNNEMTTIKGTQLLNMIHISVVQTK